MEKEMAINYSSAAREVGAVLPPLMLNHHHPHDHPMRYAEYYFFY
jgi:hypothetical protein